MITFYPNEDFAKIARAALEARDIFEVIIGPSWSARRLAKEVKSWPKTGRKKSGENPGGQSPIFIFNIFKIKLVTFHWFALSAGYEMQNIVQGGKAHLFYVPN